MCTKIHGFLQFYCRENHPGCFFCRAAILFAHLCIPGSRNANSASGVSSVQLRRELEFICIEKTHRCKRANFVCREGNVQKCFCGYRRLMRLQPGYISHPGLTESCASWRLFHIRTKNSSPATASKYRRGTEIHKKKRQFFCAVAETRRRALQ